ncbi:DUF4417 domain-containing protein [Streptococcus suis]|uniref:DUF4417 domain-containing protein n=1 Tax=Streptococcus suis TaxID=1307 RepID=A0A7T1P6B0_STRSU|nr:DUF4417 domain-containing protein [Streptococcus suis]QPO27733.1 DUF4417 domain-containing protein [Streptococcus suis]
MRLLKIEYVPINNIFPYYNNARNNDGEAVKKVATSIKEFGFQQPILVDENNVIITGHTRLKAALSIGLSTIPIAYADNLTDEQVRAYRLADNRVAEFSSWDKAALALELEAFETIDMSDFGFDLVGFELASEDELPINELRKDGIIDKEHYSESHRETTVNQYNLRDYDATRVDGKYNIPSLEPVTYVPSKLQGFNYILNKPDYSAGIHFFLDDYQFERIWQRPEFYIEKLTEFDCVLTPDFSLYQDMPIAMQIWNVYRSRLIGQMMQNYGCTVIPTVSWSRHESFVFCFDGLPRNATLAVSTIGVKKSSEQMAVWRSGMDKMIDELSPKQLIVYGGEVEYDYRDIEVFYFDNETTKRMKEKGT